MAGGIELGVYDAASILQSIIATATRWTSTQRLSKAGDINISGMPAADEALAALQAVDRPLVRCVGPRAGSVVEWGAGYVKNIDTDVDEDAGVSTLTATGPDICEELTWRRIPKKNIDDGAGHAVSTTSAISSLMAYAPSGWTIDTTTYQSTGTTSSGNLTITGVVNASNFQQGDAITGTTIPAGATVAAVTGATITLATGFAATGNGTGVVLTHPVYLQLNGETFLDAMNKLATKLQENWYATSARQLIYLYRQQPSTGIRAVGNVDGIDLESNSQAAGISSLRKTQKSETYTRIYPSGGGNSDAALTLASCTRWGASGAGNYTVGDYTLHIDADPTLCYIAYNPTDSVRRIDHAETYDDLAAAGSGGAHGASAANQLFDQALRDLQQHLTVQYSYDVTLVKVEADIPPGWTVYLDYEEYTDGRQTMQVIGEHVVQEAAPTLDENGEVISVRCQVATIATWAPTDGQRLASALRSVNSLRAHAQKAPDSIKADSATYATTAGSAAAATSVPWSGVTSPPTTLAGYGITDLIALLNAAQTFTQIIQFDGGAFINGKLRLKRSTFAASATIGTTTLIAAVTNTSAPRTITLPTGASAGTQTVYIIKDESGGAGTNSITVAGNGAELIEGAATKVINTNYGVLRLYWNGTQWMTW